MILGGTAEIQVLVATKPVDFRKQADGLAAIVSQVHATNPFSGAIYVFRSKRSDRVKLLWWLCSLFMLMRSETPAGGSAPA